MEFTRFLLITVTVLYFSSDCLCKIVLPHKLRYLENMLNAEVMAKAAKIRQRMEANPNIADMDKGWPMLLAQYQADDKNNINSLSKYNYGNLYNRRMPKF